jgi:hypothetical protein
MNFSPSFSAVTTNCSSTRNIQIHTGVQVVVHKMLVHLALCFVVALYDQTLICLDENLHPSKSSLEFHVQIFIIMFDKIVVGL